MVRVAVCPKCSHESVMSEQADSEQWARCPECRTHFQIKHAVAREIPTLVLTEDEALLAEEESQAAKETVDSALETRWDTRSTLNAASTQTIAGLEPTSTSDLSSERNDSEAISPPERVKDDAKRTVADFSNLATWSDVPVDQVEAEARAERAGETPDNYPPPSQTPTLRIRRSRDTNDDAHGAGKSSESSAESTDRFEKWFQTEAIFDLTGPTPDDAAIDLVDDARPEDEAAESSDSEDEAQSTLETEAASGDESSSKDDSDSRTAGNDGGEAPPALSPAWPQGQPVPRWARAGRRRSPLRTFIMIGFGGVVGLASGYYALMWMTGPRGDFLNAAQYLPSAILPSEFHSAAVTVSDSDSIASDSISSNSIESETIESPDVSGIDLDRGDVEQTPVPLESGESSGTEEAGGAAAVVDAPSFSTDELAVALRKAQQAQAGLVSGNFVDGGEVKRTKGQSYMAFCDLAQKATFVDKDSNPSYTSALEREVQDLVRATLDDTHAQQEIAHLVPLWIKSTKRTHGGIFFAGHVAREEVRGALVEWQIDMGHSSITVLAGASKALVKPPARPVVILGWIVDKPAEQVTGYSGQAQQAVWAGHIIPLE